VAVGVELVDQHAAEAGDGADVLAGFLGQRFDAAGVVHLEQEVADQRVQVTEIGRLRVLDRLELDQGQAIPAVRQHVEMAPVGGGDGADVERALAQIARQLGRQALRGRCADHVGQRTAERLLDGAAGPVNQVGAGLQHRVAIALGQRQQEAVRLDTAGRTNRFLVASRQVEDRS
jgi:hypothetical protein